MSESDLPLTENARLGRIGEILWNAISAHGLLEAPSAGAVTQVESPRFVESDFSSIQSDQNEERIIGHLGRVGEASPSSLRTVLRMPRTTAYRVMNRLVESGLIVSEGQTRTLVYRLADLPPHSQNVEGN